MDIEQAIELTNDSLIQQSMRALSDVETLILRGSWERKTYEAIAEAAGYSPNYFRKDVGPKLWQDLTSALGEPVSKKNFRATLERRWYQKEHAEPENTDAVRPKSFPKRVADWGDAIDTSAFLGRITEQQVLKDWITVDHCRFVFILGMGGIGKTTLSIKVGEQIESDFEFVLWRSLRNAPPLTELLIDIITFLAQRKDIELPQNLEAQTALLLQYLRENRCLIILDNAESILQAGDRNRHYLPRYDGYGYLFTKVCETLHQSCLMLTSREVPTGLSVALDPAHSARCFRLSGISVEEGYAIFESIGQFQGTAAEWHQVIERYGGNPLALRIVASYVSEVFLGDLSQFLLFFEQSTFLFDDISRLLDQQFQRLSSPEQAIMIWIALKREPVTVQSLPTDLVQKIPPHELLQILAALKSRALIEKNGQQFTQQPVVMEYVTNRVIDQVTEQMLQWRVGAPIQNLEALHQYALVQVQASDYVRETQLRLILIPVLEHLLDQWVEVAQIESQLRHILQAMRAEPSSVIGYGAGNIINMLRQLDIDLSSYNFTKLTVWQADLQGIKLHKVNFAQADLSKSRFSYTLGWVTSITVNADQDGWAIGDESGSIYLWSDQKNQFQAELRGHQGHAWSVKFSPDGQRLVSGSLDGTVRLWEVSTRKCIQAWPNHTRAVWSVAFSPDSQWVASGDDDGNINIWDCTLGHCLQTFKANSSPVHAVVFLPDGQHLLSGGADAQIHRWDLKTGECIQDFVGHEQTIWSIDVSPDGFSLISGGNDCLLKLWDLQTGDCIHSFEGHTLQLWDVAFAPDGQTFASASMDQTIRIWDIDDMDCLACFQGHNSMVMSVAFSKQGEMLLSGGIDRLVKAWDLSKNLCERTWSGYKNILWSVAVYSGQAPKELDSEGIDSSEQDALEPSEFGMIASTSLDGRVRVWRLSDGHCVQQMNHPMEVHAIAFSPEGRKLVSGNMGNDSTLKVWDVQTGGCIHTISAHSSKINGVCISHDGTLLASGGDDKNVQLFRMDNGQIDQVLVGHSAVIWSVAFSSCDQILASGSFDQTIRLWDITSGDCLHILEGHTNALTTIAFQPNRPFLATASSDGSVKLWSIETGACIRTLKHEAVVMGTAFAKQGHLYASGSYDHTIRLWDTETWTCQSVLTANAQVYSIAFSEDDKTLISSGDNGTIQVWDLETELCINTIEIPKLYAGMNICGVKGLTEAQQFMLMRLGAVVN